MARPDLDERLRRSGMQKYLLAGERPIIADRQHWAKVAREIALFVAGAVFVLFLDTSLPTTAGSVVNLFWTALIVLAGWTLWKVLLWRRNWFVATDKRMLLNHGLINVDVAILSLSKVVDLTYARSTMGRVLGYGTFVRESAGQSQTMREVEWVKKPEENYRKLCGAIFSLDDQGPWTNANDHGARSASPARTSVRQTSHEPARYQHAPLQQIPIQQTYGPYVGFPPASTEPDTIDESARVRTRPAVQPDDSDSWRPDTTMDDDVQDADDDTTT